MNKIGKNYKHIVPSGFDDPVALKTDWDWLENGSPSMQTHRLVLSDSDKLIYTPTISAIILFSSFLIAGLCLLVPFVYTLDESDSLMEKFLFGCLAGMFTISGLAMVTGLTRPIVIDKGNNIFYKRHKPSADISCINNSKNCLTLDKVYAVQLICTGSTFDSFNNYYCCEINLVLKDGQRVNVISQGDKVKNHGKCEDVVTMSRTRNEGKVIGEFLGCPVWDALDFRCQFKYKRNSLFTFVVIFIISMLIPAFFFYQHFTGK